jgi:23S rRNA (cytosine1962-C5)-methyltransferase
MSWDEVKPFIARALAARQTLPGWDDPRAALRLFNGFYEGCPGLVIDRYAGTLVIFNHADDPREGTAWLPELLEMALAALPGLSAVLVKTRRAAMSIPGRDDRQARRSPTTLAPDAHLHLRQVQGSAADQFPTNLPESASLPAVAGNDTSMDERRGRLLFGDKPDTWIEENGVRYALELTMNQDAGFYLDTRGLRAWLKIHATNRRVLNTFASTGSLGVAALAGGAARVVQLDLSRRFLGLARRSAQANRLPAEKHILRPGNFFTLSSQMRRDGEEYDLVILDPPFFASSGQGRVDLNQDPLRLINKVRPLVADGGWLVAVHNALFVSGAEYQAALEGLCAGGYLRLEERLEVPADVTGYPETIFSSPPADPTPFNHPTKIAILRVKKKGSLFPTPR